MLPADPGQFGRTGLAPVCALREIGLLITVGPGTPLLAQLRERRLQIDLAE
jgi:hypothetical protein